jgi:CRP/FNR family transcriptional regulator, cyclic AMP receptor protein
MNTIVPLRGLAIASNLLFILYGVAGHLYPVLLLHVVLLPVNIVKIVQLPLQERRVNARPTTAPRQCGRFRR